MALGQELRRSHQGRRPPVTVNVILEAEGSLKQLLKNRKQAQIR